MAGLDWFDYRASVVLSRDDPPFYALIAAAMRKADIPNTFKLRSAWPDVWSDLQARHEAPGGVLDSDSPHLRSKVLGNARRPGGQEARPDGH